MNVVDQLDVTAFACSDAGCVRARNEDACRIIQPADAAVRRARGVLAIVADGMGGHAAGELASALAVETVQRAYYDADGTPGAALTRAIVAANHAIFARAGADQSLHGMGTTCVAIACVDGLAYAAHVGDSRMYLVRAGGIYRMTNDDSAVGGMVRDGLITRAEARAHEDRNVLLKALGTRSEVQPSSWPEPLPLRAGDTFVLCSDGLTDLVDDDEIQTEASGALLDDASRMLVQRARERGGFDNITVAMLRIAAQPSEGRAPRTRASQVIA